MLQIAGPTDETSGAVEGAPPLSAEELVEYLLDVGGALLSYGCPTHRLEEVLRSIAVLEGYAADAFAVPTGLWLSLTGGALATPLVRMVRVKEWGTNLERLAFVDRVFNDVLERKLTLAEARRSLDDLERRPPAYPPVVQGLAYAGGAGAAAVFFLGGFGEVAIAAVGGLLVGLMRAAFGRGSRAVLLQDFIGAVIAATLAWAATALAPRVWPGAQLSRQVLVLSVVILLVPGMALTTGLAELVHKNLVSGAAKLMEAMMAFISIVFGVAVVIALEQRFGAPSLSAPPPGTPPLWLSGAALLVASSSFAVMFSVPRRLLPGALISGALGWIVTSLGVRALPGSFAAFTAALSVALFANLAARVTNRPVQIYLLPGLVLLVPGSFGFVSLEEFLRGHFLDGAAKGFDMFLTAGAIVTALLVANLLLPARKLL